MAGNDPLAYLADEIEALKQAGTYRPLRILETEQSSRVVMDGREVITLSTNNYLGLTTHPRLRQAAIAAIEKWGVGTGAVRTIAGTMSIHEELERKLADFKHAEACLMFQSGYTANLGVLSCLVGEQDIVLSDELNHASIIDGMRLSRAPRKVYPHKDLNALEKLLQESRGARSILIVTDGVFSMDGDIAPLPGIVDLAERYNAAVMVDDAHSSGVLGRNGRGTVDHFNLNGRVQLQVGTLSKAVGAVGGYVVGSQRLRDFLIHRSRAFLFTTSHPPSVVATCIAAIDVMLDEPELVEKLWDNTRYFKSRLNTLGFDTGHSETPITPIMIGDEGKAGQLSDRLFQDGVFAQPILFPMVPRGSARIRTIVTAGHSREQLDYCLDALARIGRELGIVGTPVSA
jgi:glycine C-acetyltransferase